ncbi:hypothetical protein UK23_21725 [Lentzea aerocolonigenes]|uniref:Lipoprotein n=1 Tax=Lentzea aerocolonigenes TaxID=68170 RepID=A0A0F0GWP4_LENAE|nr:hypothetical protein [Lentzea aerocolonigenes]KJK46976.1 hypothetical protein UK23_21725 [Lentzea aerocolonigenes]
MKVGKPVVRALVVSGLALGIATAGLALPAQANPFAPEANAASCAAFTRAKVVSKREILTTVVDGELRNMTSKQSVLVLDRIVTDSRETSTEYSAQWSLFSDALKLGVSRTVTEGHTVTGTQQGRFDVAAHTTVIVTGQARSWYVKTEVTQRDSKCKYKTWQVQGEVASSGGLVWTARQKR